MLTKRSKFSTLPIILDLQLHYNHNDRFLSQLLLDDLQRCWTLKLSCIEHGQVLGWVCMYELYWTELYELSWHQTMVPVTNTALHCLDTDRWAAALSYEVNGGSRESSCKPLQITCTPDSMPAIQTGDQHWAQSPDLSSMDWPLTFSLYIELHLTVSKSWDRCPNWECAVSLHDAGRCHLPVSLPRVVFVCFCSAVVPLDSVLLPEVFCLRRLVLPSKVSISMLNRWQHTMLICSTIFTQNIQVTRNQLSLKQKSISNKIINSL